MIPSDQPHLGIIALSHPGEQRSSNEDRYRTAHYTTKETTPQPVVFAVVADGIGGHQAGEVAAELTVDAMLAEVAASNGEHPLETLKQGTLRSWSRVHQQSEQLAEYEGMGSTLAAAMVISNRLYTVTVGDSRIYLLHQGQLRQISIDHTWIQEALDRNIITREEARTHPNAHVLRRHIGGKKAPEPDVRMMLEPGESDRSAQGNQGFLLSPGDQVLLCSDGLTDLLSGQEIQTAITKHPPQEAVRLLLDAACERGGHDNVTILLLTAPETLHSTDFKVARFLLLSFFSVLLLLLITGAALALGWWFGLWPWM